MPRQYTRYDFASGQRYLLVVRIFEIVLALIEIILLSYSGVHHGYWNNLGSALGFGSTFLQLLPPRPHSSTTCTYSHSRHTLTARTTVTASILTVPIAAVTLAKYNDARATTSRHRFFLYYMRVITEIILIAFWTAAFISMLLPKGKDYRQLFDKPPYVWWDIAILISVFQMSV